MQRSLSEQYAARIYWVSVKFLDSSMFDVYGPYTLDEAINRRQDLLAQPPPSARISNVFRAETPEQAIEQKTLHFPCESSQLSCHQP